MTPLLKPIRVAPPCRTRRWGVSLVVLSALLTVAVAAPPRGDAQSTPLQERLRALDALPLAGDPPPFKLTGLDGQRYSLASLKGRPALLYFWATW